MSTKLKLNVKNITLGFQNFSDVLAGHEYKIHHGFSRLVVPKSIPLRRPDCKYYQQDYVRRSTLDFSKLLLWEPKDKLYLKRVSSDIPITGKWLETIHAGPICMPGYGLPWETAYSYYYDKKNPECPAPGPAPCPAPTRRCPPRAPQCPPPEPQCPPPNPACPPKMGRDCKPAKKPRPCPPPAPECPEPAPECPKKPKGDPCCHSMCTFAIPMKLCRFYSSKACPPKKPPGGDGPDKCKPKPCEPKKMKPGGKGSVCPPQKKVKDCPPTGTKKAGSMCPPRKQVRDCPPKGGRKGGGKGPVCPPRKKVKDCPPKGGRKGGGSVCPPVKKVSGCPPKRRSSSKAGGGSRCGKVKKQKPRKCGPKGSKSTGGGKSKSKCRPVLKPRACKPKSSSASSCGPKDQPKKPKKC